MVAIVNPVVPPPNPTLVTVPPPGTNAPIRFTMSVTLHFLVAFAGSVSDTSENTNKSLPVGVADGYV